MSCGDVLQAEQKNSKKFTNRIRPDPKPTSWYCRESELGEDFGLHAGPTYAVFAIVALATATTSFFVSEYLVEIVRTEALFFMGSYVIFASYFMFHYYLTKLSRSYASISSDKQFYVLSNCIKAAMLASMTPFALHLLYMALIQDVWISARIRNLGCLYAIPDFVSLLLVRKMSSATKAHHVCVCVFNYLSCQNDYAQENICRLIVVYAVFSTLAFLVNLLLASRFLNISREWFILLSSLSLGIYVSACGINWTWQVWYIARLVSLTNHWSIYVYCTLLSAIVYDDLVLMKWLVSNISKQQLKVE